MTASRPTERTLVGRDEAEAFAHRSWQVLKESVQALFDYRGRRRPLVRRYLFPLLRRVTPSVAVESGGIWYFVSTRDQFVSRDAFAYGSYDEDVMVEVLSVLEHHAGRPDALRNRTFVDVGANIGSSTITALNRFGAADAIALEPEPGNLKLLRCNLLMNDLEDRVKVVPVAISDRGGLGSLELAKDNLGDHRVRSALVEEGRFREGGRPTMEVQLARLEDITAEVGTNLSDVGMVWVDTQGHEGHVLAGAPSLLASNVPVVIEYWPYGLERAGGLRMLHELVAGSYREVVDVRASIAAGRVVGYPADRLDDLRRSYRGLSFTDLLLLK